MFIRIVTHKSYFCGSTSSLMSKIYTTEITSEEIQSDNPIHQRLTKAYVVAEEFVSGNLLEIGCGEGRGFSYLKPFISQYTAVDKIESAILKLQQKHPEGKFIRMDIPPFHHLTDNTYDSIVSFQVIEHIQDDKFFLKEIHRVLKPGGIALLTTPNRKMSLSRNPWHIREYLPKELEKLAANFFPNVEMKGITGNEKVMEYYVQNKKSVEHIWVPRQLAGGQLRWSAGQLGACVVRITVVNNPSYCCTSITA
jgi:2-polyprenyl-3-methyl-5-hydroxy-6-metoxy-1,4-benzoquinol methylase